MQTYCTNILLHIVYIQQLPYRQNATIRSMMVGGNGFDFDKVVICESKVANLLDIFIISVSNMIYEYVVACQNQEIYTAWVFIQTTALTGLTAFAKHIPTTYSCLLAIQSYRYVIYTHNLRIHDRKIYRLGGSE